MCVYVCVFVYVCRGKEGRWMIQKQGHTMHLIMLRMSPCCLEKEDNIEPNIFLTINCYTRPYWSHELFTNQSWKYILLLRPCWLRWIIKLICNSKWNFVIFCETEGHVNLINNGIHKLTNNSLGKVIPCLWVTLFCPLITVFGIKLFQRP